MICPLRFDNYRKRLDAFYAAVGVRAVMGDEDFAIWLWSNPRGLEQAPSIDPSLEREFTCFRVNQKLQSYAKLKYY